MTKEEANAYFDKLSRRAGRHGLVIEPENFWGDVNRSIGRTCSMACTCASPPICAAATSLCTGPVCWQVARRFEANFAQFVGAVDEDVRAAGIRQRA
jgi:hypothetical protein